MRRGDVKLRINVNAISIPFLILHLITHDQISSSDLSRYPASHYRKKGIKKRKLYIVNIMIIILSPCIIMNLCPYYLLILLTDSLSISIMGHGHAIHQAIDIYFLIQFGKWLQGKILTSLDLKERESGES